MAVYLNRGELAAHMGVSLPTIDRWIKEGMPVHQRGSKGSAWTFDLPDVVKWWGDRRAEMAAGEKATDEAESTRRKKAAEAALAELELAKKKGEVATIRDFERIQAKAMAAIRANVMNVPARAVLQLLGCTDETEFKSKLRAELVLALESAAEADLAEDEDEDAEE